MLRIRSGERTSSETESSRISAAVSSFCGSRAIVTRSPLESSRSGHVAKNLQARYAARSMKRASVAIVAACVTCIACAQKPTSRAFGSASTVAVPAGPPSPQMVDGAPVPSGPSMISFVAEVPEGVETTLYRLPSGVALFEASEKGWQLRVARGRGPLSPVDALSRAPERRRHLDALFAGESGDEELWLSLLDDREFPALHFVTLRVKGTTLKRIPGKWYRALAALDGGSVIALPTAENPAVLADEAPQKFERVAGTNPKTPAIPGELRLYDVDSLASGEIHALAVRNLLGPIELVAWIASPGAAPRTLTLPREVAQEQARLVRGGTIFVASVDSKGLWIGERGEGLIIVKNAMPFTSAAADRDGYVWFAEDVPQSPPRVWRGRINFGSDGQLKATTIPLPSAAELEAAGAHDCRELGFIDAIVTLADGNVWLSANCARGAHAILRAST